MTDSDEHTALLQAMQGLLTPFARLLVARGVSYAIAEEGLKGAMVEAARAAHPDGLAHRLVSRIATSTGINRREVTRLTHAAETPAPSRRSSAAELFARWGTAARYLDASGHPRVLPRQGDAPSFEALARSVTQDVHPRSLLDELLRLGFASHDVERDTVAVTLDNFVPSADRKRMLEFLGNNVGDHLSAAVENVIGATPRHLERAVFAYDLSPESVAAAQQWVASYWQQMLATLVPFIEQLIAQDDAAPEREKNRRFRTGLYAYTEQDAAPAVAPDIRGSVTVRTPRARKSAAKSTTSAPARTAPAAVASTAATPAPQEPAAPKPRAARKTPKIRP